MIRSGRFFQLKDLAWSFAKAATDNVTLWVTLEQAVLTAGIRELHDAELSNLLWSFSKAGCKAPELFRAAGYHRVLHVS